MPARVITPPRAPTSNSTSASTSLSEVKSSRSTDPKNANLRMWLRRQNASISFLETFILMLIFYASSTERIRDFVKEAENPIFLISSSHLHPNDDRVVRRTYIAGIDTEDDRQQRRNLEDLVREIR